VFALVSISCHVPRLARDDVSLEDARTQTPGSVDWPTASGIAWSLGVVAVAALAWGWWRSQRARRRLSSQTIASLTAALDAARHQVDLFSESQERFVGSLARELEAPLANLRIRADLILAGSADSITVHRYSRSIADDLRHLHDLVQGFLRLAHPHAQEDTSSHVPVHIQDLVLEAVRRCRSLARTREISVVPMLAEGRDTSSIQVLGDAVLLEAMIENLVRNGVLAAPPGTRVDLHVRVAGNAVVVAVRDHGASVDEDRRRTVFAGFFPVPAPPRHSAGSSLGLAIAKRVAEHHRGTISLHNPPDGGCEFAVELPRWLPEAPPGSSRGPSSPPVKPARSPEA